MRNKNESAWYMVRCATTKEEKAIQKLEVEIEVNNLQKYVDEIVCPKEKKFFMRNNKKVARDKIMFPGYFLMKMKLIGELPRVIKRTDLVIEIAGDSGDPTPLREFEVERIFGNVEKSNEVIDFLEGEEVKITSGPFSSFSAIIKSADISKNKVKVEVMVFGQPTPLELSYTEIDKV